MAAEPGSASPAGEGSRPRLTKQREGEGRWERPLAAGQRGGGPGPERLGGPPQPGRYALPCPTCAALCPGAQGTPRCRLLPPPFSFFLLPPRPHARTAPGRDGTAPPQRHGAAGFEPPALNSTAAASSAPPSAYTAPALTALRCAAPSGRLGERRDPPHCTALHCTASERPRLERRAPGSRQTGNCSRDDTAVGLRASEVSA